MKGQEEQQEQQENPEDPDCDSEPDKHWWCLNYRRVNRDISQIIEVQCLPWSNWFEQYHHTLCSTTDYDTELWIYMHEKEWDFLAPWSRPRQDQWYAGSPSNEGIEIWDRFRRLCEYDAMLPQPTEASVTYDWLER